MDLKKIWRWLYQLFKLFPNSELREDMREVARDIKRGK